MKTIGVIGGMSAASTQTYYQLLCDGTRARLGGLHSPDLLIRSVDFAPVAALQAAGDWGGAGTLLNREALALERGGADMLLLATNTMHKVADAMMRGVAIPLLHIADATAARIRAQGLRAPGLIATAFTMEQAFYRDRLTAHGLQPIVPDADDRAEVHRIIYEELCRDIVTAASAEIFAGVAARLASQGADCVILGCTEVGMLLHADNVPRPVFDTTRIHCESALDMALEVAG